MSPSPKTYMAKVLMPNPIFWKYNFNFGSEGRMM